MNAQPEATSLVPLDNLWVLAVLVLLVAFFWALASWQKHRADKDSRFARTHRYLR